MASLPDEWHRTRAAENGQDSPRMPRRQAKTPTCSRMAIACCRQWMAAVRHVPDKRQSTMRTSPRCLSGTPYKLATGPVPRTATLFPWGNRERTTSGMRWQAWCCCRVGYRCSIQRAKIPSDIWTDCYWSNGMRQCVDPRDRRRSGRRGTAGLWAANAVLPQNVQPMRCRGDKACAQVTQDKEFHGVQ